jgi:hypothetical protein
MAIATAARHGRPVDARTINNVVAVSRRAPLQPEPYLVSGVQAQIAGNQRLAETAFEQAEWREGRSLPARYFLAQRYFQRGDQRRGLAEVAVLSRLAPNGVQSLAPYVAAYARDRANWTQLRSMFSQSPALADAALSELARDPNAAGAVMALGGPARPGGAGNWLPVMLNALIEARQYERARQIWAAWFPSGQQQTLIFDPEFRQPDPLRPFNWSLVSSTVGLADRQPGGGLHVIFYGQEDGVLVGQLVLLKSGRYRSITKAAAVSDNDEALQWRLTCAPTNALIAASSLKAATEGWRFEVPADCPAQRLELVGTAADIQQQAEARILRFDVRRETPNG